MNLCVRLAGSSKHRQSGFNLTWSKDFPIVAYNICRREICARNGSVILIIVMACGLQRLAAFSEGTPSLSMYAVVQVARMWLSCGK